MALTLQQLLSAPTVDNWRATLLAALNGLGVVVAGGSAAGGIQSGTGSISLSGTPAQAFTKIVVKVVTAGELGAGVFQYSLDGGTTYSASNTIPALPGAFALSTTGVTVTFASGPAGAGTSFALNDTFSFALATPSLQVTAWPASGAFRQLVEIEAQALASLAAQQAGLAAGGFTTSATGSWADLLGTNFYNLTRNPAAATKGQITLTDAASAGPFTIAAGQMFFASTSGLRYTNTNGGTLAKGGSLNLLVAAESPGAAYNVGNGTITSIVAGTLPGVTVNNPDPGSGTWISSQGADQETDLAYMLRCTQRWPSLAAPGTSPAGQFVLWCLSAEAAVAHATTVTKVLAQPDAVVPGQADVYLAGASGAVLAQAIADVQSYLAARVGLTNSVVVASAANAVMTVAGTVFYFASKTTLTAVQAAVAANLAAYFTSVGIGSDNAGAVKVYWSEIIGAAASALGVRNLLSPTLNGGTADVALTLGQVATLTNSLTFTAV